jgi:hypothetical protein
MSDDLVPKYRDRAHCGFRSLSPENEGMGSIETVARNLVHTGGEYRELWHSDGFSIETSGAVSRIWQEAKSLGFDAYKRN